MHTVINHSAARRLTIKSAMSILRDIGCTLRCEHGELRVNLKGAPEAQAYYTNDLNDAVFTAIHMGNQRTARKIAEINETIASMHARSRNS